MKKLFRTVAAVGMFLLAAGATHAEEVSQTRAITASVTRVALDGMVNLQVRQGATPSLVVYAEPQMLPKITATQSGDTLSIGNSTSSGRIDRTPMRAELTLPVLTAFLSRGVGNSQISGFDGKALQLELQGSGSINLNSQYQRIDARLSGVGHMNITGNGSGESIAVALPGAGNITLNGAAKSLTADLGGVGNLDARNLQTNACDIDLNGMSSATVNVKDNVAVDLNGIGSVTIYGKPAKYRIEVNGIGKVIWK